MKCIFLFFHKAHAAAGLQVKISVDVSSEVYIETDVCMTERSEVTDEAIFNPQPEVVQNCWTINRFGSSHCK